MIRESGQKAPLIVLDTNVLVAGLCRCRNSPSYKILRDIQQGKVPLALTMKLFLEYESVLKRKPILELTGLTVREVQIVLDALVAIANESEVSYLWRPNLPDESDNFVMETAIASGALIVTKNVRDFAASELKFNEVEILTPRQFCDLYL